MEMLAAAELRQLALSSSTAEVPHVSEALRTGDIWIRHAVTQWESSEGTTLGHLVGIGLDAALLAHVAPEPQMVDALTIAIAEAVAWKPLESLSELRIHWNGAIRTRGSYRGDDLRTGSRIADALEIYLEEREEKKAAALAGHAKIDIQTSSSHARGRPEIVVTIDLPRRTAENEHDLRVLVEACTILLGGPEGANVRVMQTNVHV